MESSAERINPPLLPEEALEALVRVRAALVEAGYDPEMAQCFSDGITVHPDVPLEVDWRIQYDLGIVVTCWPCTVKMMLVGGNIWPCRHDPSLVMP